MSFLPRSQVEVDALVPAPFSQRSDSSIDVPVHGEGSTFFPCPVGDGDVAVLLLRPEAGALGGGEESAADYGKPWADSVLEGLSRLLFLQRFDGFLLLHSSG